MPPVALRWRRDSAPVTNRRRTRRSTSRGHIVRRQESWQDAYVLRHSACGPESTTLPGRSADFMSNGPTAPANGLHAHLDPEQARLPAGDVDFGPAPQLHVQLPADAEIDVFNEVYVDDLLTIGAKEALRIEPLLQAVQGPSEQRTLSSP